MSCKVGLKRGFRILKLCRLILIWGAIFSNPDTLFLIGYGWRNHRFKEFCFHFPSSSSLARLERDGQNMCVKK